MSNSGNANFPSTQMFTETNSKDISQNNFNDSINKNNSDIKSININPEHSNIATELKNMANSIKVVKSEKKDDSTLESMKEFYREANMSRAFVGVTEQAISSIKQLITK